jgi:hypothetical protein
MSSKAGLRSWGEVRGHSTPKLSPPLARAANSGIHRGVCAIPLASGQAMPSFLIYAPNVFLIQSPNRSSKLATKSGKR